jgi:hypothetical protein
MRVIWLRKKLVEYEPSVFEEGLTVYHGTNLPNLYLILKDGKLGSKIGRHTGAFRRVGKFYITKDIEEALAYAEDAARDQTYYIPGHMLPTMAEVKENLSNFNRLKEVLKAHDLYDLFVKFASLLRFYKIPGGAVYPRVVIKLTIRKPEVLEKIYFDEDEFRDWLAEPEHLNDPMIVVVATKDPKFFDWVLDKVSGYTITMTPNELAWKLALLPTEEYYGYEYEGEEEEEEEEREEEEKHEEELPPAPQYIPEEFHEVAKRIYGALIRLAEELDIGAYSILEDVKSRVQSFFIRGYTPLEDIDEATATVYLTGGREEEIDLKSPEALQKVEEIMWEQIRKWIHWIV